MPAPHRISERKLAANRRNAKKSTGPCTPGGKERSRSNAVRHGILSRQVIPPSLQAHENPAAFDALLADLRQEHAPATPSEAFLVETVASCQWRLGRLARAEGGAIAQAQERAAAANQRRAEYLASIAADVDDIQGALAAGDMDALRHILDPEGLYSNCNTDQGALAMAQDQLTRAHTATREEGFKRPQSALDRAALPEPRQALLYARYEAHLYRQLHRALATLHRLQRRRPAPGPTPPSAPATAPTPPSPAPPSAASSSSAVPHSRAEASTVAACTPAATPLSPLGGDVRNPQRTARADTGLEGTPSSPSATDAANCQSAIGQGTVSGATHAARRPSAPPTPSQAPRFAMRKNTKRTHRAPLPSRHGNNPQPRRQPIPPVGGTLGGPRTNNLQPPGGLP